MSRPTASPPHFPYTAADGHRTMAEVMAAENVPETKDQVYNQRRAVSWDATFVQEVV